MKTEFRGKTLDTKRWAFGDKCTIQGKTYIILDDADLDAHYTLRAHLLHGIVEVDPESVGMFAGKLDKNDTELCTTCAGDKIDELHHQLADAKAEVERLREDTTAQKQVYETVSKERMQLREALEKIKEHAEPRYTRKGDGDGGFIPVLSSYLIGIDDYEKVLEALDPAKNAKGADDEAK